MKKALSFAMAITLAFTLCGCMESKPSAASSTPGATGTDSPPPTASIPTIIPDAGKTSNRAWRYYVSVQTDTTQETIAQGDCKTTYDTVEAFGIKDDTLRTWAEWQIYAFNDKILKDTGIIDNTKALFKERGLDAKYPGATFIRKIKTEVTGIGSILSIKTKDYCVFRPTDADIVKYELGYTNEGDAETWYDYEDSFAYYYGDGDDEFYLPEAYSYNVKTLCLDLAGKKPMTLSDLFKPGADYTNAINRDITSQILQQDMEENEVLKRPFAGIGNDYPTFFIEKRGTGTYLQIPFNEDSPFFNFNAIRDWCAYRYFSIDNDKLAYMLTPLLRDDSLLQSVSTMPPEGYGNYYGTATGDRTMPDFGFGEYGRENGGSSIHVVQMQNPGIKDILNQGIAEFEQKNVTRENILNLQGLDAETAQGAVVSIDAAAKETGPFLTVTYDADISCDEGDGYVELDAVFDLNTGKRLTLKDLLKADYLQDKEYKKASSDILEDYVSIGNTGTIYAYYRCKPGESFEGEDMPTAYSQLDLSKYFDREKWAATPSPAYDPGEPAAPSYPAGGVNEDRWGYITRVYTSNGTEMIDIDYVELYTGAEAMAKATEDGKTPEANGMYVRNSNTKVRSFPLSHWCRITVTDTGSQSGNGQKSITWQELQAYANPASPILVHVYAKKGYVTSMDQRLQ